MKKNISLLSFLLLSLQIFAQSSKWKPGLGFDFGLGGAGMTALYKTNNPQIIHNSSLSRNWLNTYTIGFFTQFMKSRQNSAGHKVPGYGVKIKLSYNGYSAESDNLVDNEAIKINVLSVPVLFRICLSANEVDVPSSSTSDSYEISGNTVYYYPGQYSPGYRTTRSVFFYFGPQYDVIDKAKYTYNGTSADLKSSFQGTGYSLVAGLEIMLGKVSLDVSYQKGMKSISSSYSNYIKGVFVRFGFSFI